MYFSVAKQEEKNYITLFVGGGVQAFTELSIFRAFLSFLRTFHVEVIFHHMLKLISYN